MIDRYKNSISNIWTDIHKYNLWLLYQVNYVNILAEKYSFEKIELKRIKKSDIKKIKRYEHQTKHDVTAFLEFLQKDLYKHNSIKNYFHFGLTSSDMKDTCFSIQLNESKVLINKSLNGLLSSIQSLIYKSGHIVIAGRTHGVIGEPTKVRFIFGNLYKSLSRRMICSHLLWGKASGSMGIHSHSSSAVEYELCEIMSLTPADKGSQIISRDIYCEYFSGLALLASVVERLATQIRLLHSRDLILEGFSDNQNGSSSMPNKMNPYLSESVVGMTRLIRSMASSSLENIPTWDQRDLTHSSHERVISEDITTLVYETITRMTNVVNNLTFNSHEIKNDLSKVDHSQIYMNQLIKGGMSRRQAYKMSKTTPSDLKYDYFNNKLGE